MDTMFIGDRKTKHETRAFRARSQTVVIPKNAILHDVRTRCEPGYPFPVALPAVAHEKPKHVHFEYRGETLYLHFVHGLIEATTAVRSN